ncbi:MAG: hypothetical protein J7521_04145 [Caulobacter sp.]|nr:hypothetical protein [Caulobacter sp.]
MTNLVYPIVSKDTALSGPELEGLARSPNGELSRALAAWRAGPYADYLHGQALRGVRSLRFSVEVKTQDPAVLFVHDDKEITVDQDLFVGVVVLYGQYGWDGVAAMLACLKGHTEHTARVVRAAVETLEPAIARTLLAIEVEATNLAQTQAVAQKEYIDEQLKCFQEHPDPFWGTHRLRISDADKERLVSGLQEARRRQKTVLSLDPGVKERIAKDGGAPEVVLKRRKQEEYRRLLAEYWEGRQKVELDKLFAAQAQIGAAFSPALAILDDIGDDINDWIGPLSLRSIRNDTIRLRSTKLETTYEQKIYLALVSMREQLDNHIVSLSSPGLSSKLFTALAAPSEDRWKAGGLHQIAIAEAVRLKGVLEVQQDYYQVNRILGRDAILGQMMSRADTDRPATLHQAVLRQYLLDLDRHLERRRQEDAFYASVWHDVEVATALASLLIAAASIPFGGGAVAVPAALTSLLGLLTVSTCVVSLALLAHSLVKLVGDNAQAGGEVVEQLIRTGVLNPKAMAEVGRLIVRKQALFKALSVGLVKDAALLALGHKLKPLAFALDMQGHLDDMETLGAAL